MAHEEKDSTWNIVCLSDVEDFVPPKVIGSAEFIEDNLTIRVYLDKEKSSYYEVDMERHDLEGWLTHLNRKIYTTSEMLGDLARLWIYHKDKIPK
jgi:hypothetical protein